MRSFLFIIVSCIFYLALTSFTGIYYGWVDDIWLDLSFQGKIIVEEPYSPVYLITLFGEVIKSTPLTLTSLYSAVVIFIFYLTLIIVDRHLQGLLILSKAVLMVLVIICLIWPILIAPTFTELSLLTGGLGLVNFIHLLATTRPIKKSDYFLFGLAMMIAIGFRFTSLILLLPFIGVLLVNHWCGRHQQKVIGACVFLALLSISSVLYQNTNLPSGIHQKQIKLSTVVDSDVRMHLDKENSAEFAKDLAMYCWFLGDTSVWTDARLDDKISEISYTPKDKWAAIYNKAANQFPLEYHPESNWFNMFTILISLCVIIIFRLFCLGNRVVVPFGLLIAFLIVLAFIGSVYKLEGRAVIPLVTVLFLYLLTISKNTTPAVWNASLLRIGFWALPLGAYSMAQQYHVAQQYSEEISEKKAYVHHLDTTYKNKTVIVDLLAMSLFHGTLTEGLNIPENVKLTSYPEQWGVLKALEEEGELPSPSEYFSLAAQNNALYLGPQFRVAMIESLLNDAYNTPISFYKVENCPIQYSYSWDPLNLAIYQVKITNE